MQERLVQKRLIDEYMLSEPNLPRLPLNVPAILKPTLDNFDAHVVNFIKFLKNRINCILIYDGPEDVYSHILNRTVYACSVKHLPSGKVLRNIFPVMLGTKLDMAIRHKKIREIDNGIPTVENIPFEDMDIGRGFFIICGYLRQLPFSFTNDPTRTHLVHKKCMRVFMYDTFDRGKELSYYTHDSSLIGKIDGRKKDSSQPPLKRQKVSESSTQQRKMGTVVIKCNKGTESSENTESFFDFCPYPTNPATYMSYIYRHDSFDIDSLTNKIVLSPGHLFVKLFLKCLYGPLIQEKINWPLVKNKTAKMVKSIESGKLSGAISQKTKFHKDGKGHESYREIGADGEIFVEKSAECYREVNSQTYPLNPFFTQLIVRQTSNKVKSNSMPPFHESYTGFLCILGCFETKNVGRTTMMVRDTIISTCFDLDPVFGTSRHSEFWSWLNLEPSTRSDHFVVVNEACIPVTQACFERMDLYRVKLRFRHIECYKENNFIHIHYKAGLFFKKISNTEIWVTPRDMLYWMKKLFGMTNVYEVVQHFGYNFMTSHFVDINPFYLYTAFTKDILAFNSLKSAVLAPSSRSARYFMDTLTVYIRQLTPYHKNVMEPLDDGVSPHFVCLVPQVTVSYMSFLGCTQEDCIVRRKDVNAFDCCRFYTIRVKVESDGLVVFHPIQGDAVNSTLLGTLMHESPIKLEPFSIHVKTVRVNEHIVHLHFTKKPFQMVKYHLTANTLSVCVEQPHVNSSGDKLCSFHGQKGVLRVKTRLPLLNEHTTPDLIVNPYCLFRMTPGQVKEGMANGGGNATIVRNSFGKLIPNAKLFYGKVFYFPIAYFSSEHLYAPENCTQDKILSQCVKGRSRLGGMRLGNMEIHNGLMANGIAACFEEKCFENGDRSKMEGSVAIPKVVELVQEDAKFFKGNLSFDTVQSVTIEKKRKKTLNSGPNKRKKSI